MANPPINWINLDATNKANALVSGYASTDILSSSLNFYPGDVIPMGFGFLKVNIANASPYPFRILNPSGFSGFVVQAGALGQLPDGGSYTLTGTGTSSGTTGAIAFNAPAVGGAGSMQTLIHALVNLGSATVESPQAGVYLIESNDSTLGHASDDLTYDAAALAPNGSIPVINKTQIADGALTNRWEIQLVRAFVIYERSFSALDSSAFSLTPIQAGSDSPPLSSKSFSLTFNRDSLAGAFNLKATAPDGTTTGTIGPIPYNVNGPTFEIFFTNAPGVTPANGLPVSITQNDAGSYTITCINDWANSPSVDLAVESETLEVPTGYQTPMRVSSAGALALFENTTEDSIPIVLVMRLTQTAGQPATVVQTTATLFKSFPTNGNVATGEPQWATIGDVEQIAPHIFADNTAKNNDTPFEAGQLGFKKDDHTLWYAGSNTMGDWQHSGMGALSWDVGASGEGDGILRIYGGGAGVHYGTISAPGLTADGRSWTMPDKSGIVALTSDIAESPWLIKTTTYTAVAKDAIQADTSGGAFTITLPSAATVGDYIQIEDATGTWAANNLTIARNGLKINNNTSNYTGNLTGQKLSIVYISSGYGWSIK